MEKKPLFFKDSGEMGDVISRIKGIEEINDLVEKLKLEMKKGQIQFRADKVVEKYKVPRKIVISAFHKIAESNNVELIDENEGAKDLILLIR